jgi:hypothetical protein
VLRRDHGKLTMISFVRIVAQRMGRHVLPVALVFGFVLQCGISSAADDAAIYQYRGRDYVPTGSSIARHLVWTSSLPFDKTYGELTPTQKELVRDQYVEIKPDAEPPYPQAGTQAIFKLVDASASSILPQPDRGEVVAVAKIDTNGDVTSVTVYKTPSPIVTAAITSALASIKFQPALQAGVPVVMEFVLRATLR